MYKRKERKEKEADSEVSGNKQRWGEADSAKEYQGVSVSARGLPEVPGSAKECRGVPSASDSARKATKVMGISRLLFPHCFSFKM